MPLRLTTVEARLLGALIEKENTTPEYYPLTLHSLTAAANQTSNREPVMSLDERTVEQGVDGLREKKLAVLIRVAGARVPKYRHTLLDMFELQARELALLGVLLLRGPQTPGELKSRSGRMASFASLLEVEADLESLGRGDSPLVAALPQRPGQKERRYVQLLTERTEEPSAAGDEMANVGSSVDPPRVAETLQHQIDELRAELQTLREEFELRCPPPADAAPPG